MKTIEQGAREYANEQFEEHLGVLYSECMADFTAGAEFVQTWIDVNEELPLLSSKGYEVMAKYKDNSGSSYAIISIRNVIDVARLKKNFNYWRPIEYK